MLSSEEVEMATTYRQYQPEYHSTSLHVGDDAERASAKRRRQNDLRADLQLQMQEKNAAKQRERLQGMSVNASGYLDPEKGPERFKPLGGVDWTERRQRGENRVVPYHTLFLYDQQPAQVQPMHSFPAQYDNSYQLMAARDITIGHSAPLVQPLQPIHDTRPIIIQQPAPSYEWHGPKFNPVTIDIPARNSTLLLEEARLKIKLERDNDEHKRRLQRELDENQRRLRESEAEARRRLEELRLDSENRRREAERQRREWERLMRMKELERPRTIPTVKPSSGRNRLLDDMDLYRQKLREEKHMIEELLMNRKPIEPARFDIRVVRKPRPQIEQRPPTPPTPDNANPENVHMFTQHKYRDYKSRQQFRSLFPDVPQTNVKLEWQQGALLQQQDDSLRQLHDTKIDVQKNSLVKQYFFSRPVWMDREVTPFGRLKKRRNYTSNVWDSVDDLGFRSHRRNSADTLADDTWLRPSSNGI